MNDKYKNELVGNYAIRLNLHDLDQRIIRALIDCQANSFTGKCVHEEPVKGFSVNEQIFEELSDSLKAGLEFDNRGIDFRFQRAHLVHHRERWNTYGIFPADECHPDARFAIEELVTIIALRRLPVEQIDYRLACTSATASLLHGQPFLGLSYDIFDNACEITILHDTIKQETKIVLPSIVAKRLRTQPLDRFALFCVKHGIGEDFHERMTDGSTGCPSYGIESERDLLPTEIDIRDKWIDDNLDEYLNEDCGSSYQYEDDIANGEYDHELSTADVSQMSDADWIAYHHKQAERGG